MVRKTLFLAVGLGIFASSVSAQEDTWYDDRWSITPSVGINLTDSKRRSDDGYVLGLGLGRFISPRFHIEFDVNYSEFDQDGGGDWSTLDSGVTGRLFFANLDGRVRPYALAGLRSIKHDRDGARDGRDAGAHLGLGVLAPINDRLSFRGEAIYRYDTDDQSIVTEDDYSDWLLMAGLSLSIGEASGPSEPPPSEDPPPPPTEDPPPPPPEECVDADGDGVCDDRDNCLNSTPGAMVDRNGCEVAEVIDLRGVNFDFDKCNLRPDAVEILNNAVGVLKSNELRVSVEGHTDAVGTDAYNQTLSECRAKVVYDYLLDNGVESGKVTGHVGFGESQPIDTNETAEGRARNRRTELKKQ
jgi:OmpA-OmpF porin, OOP family